jgi:two-component system cell cycle response regulator
MTLRGRILLVDDDRRNVMVLAVRLKALGYEVVEAFDGAEALQIAQTTYLDLVLSDIMMPKVDGIELTRALKEDPAHEGLPVVLITASYDASVRARALAAGADDFLSKPISPSELQARVRTHIRLRQLEREFTHRLEHVGVVVAPPAAPAVGRIFIIDDDPSWALTAAALREKGHTVLTAATIESGLARAAAAEPDLLIVQVHLHDGSASTLIQHVLENQATANPPTILVVGDSNTSSDKLDALRAGADGYLVHPVSPEEIEVRIRAHLRRSHTSHLLEKQVVQARLRAATDPLTGLFNRGYLHDDLTRRAQRASAGQPGFSVAMVDIDHFKEINDTYGHLVGDGVIRAIADHVVATMRQGDVVCRFGGDEFCVIMPATRLPDALSCMNRLIHTLAPSQNRLFPACIATLSIGVAEWAIGESPNDVIDRADRAVYSAKRLGRDRVEHAR